jgi:LPS-assembly protein
MTRALPVPSVVCRRCCLLAMCLLVAAPCRAGQQAAAPAQTPAPAPQTGGQGGPEAPSPLAQLLNSQQGKWELVTPDHLRLTDQVELEPPGGMVKFFADQVDIYISENRLEASGNVVFSEPDGRIAADRVEFNLGTGTGTFHDASGIMSMGKTANARQFAGQEPDVYFYGETIEKLPDRKYRITKGAFTTCVQPTPRWEVTSKSVDITLDDYAFARNTVLRVRGMPVLYLPVIYYPLAEDERATGFLLPTYGTSTNRGQAISNGFFWAIGRSQDATFMYDWFTRSGQGGGAEYRYIADAQSSGNAKVYAFDRKQTVYTSSGTSTPTTLPASTSYDVSANVNHRLSQRLRARARVDYFSDVLTQRLYQQDFYQSTRSTRTIDGSVSGTFGRTSVSGQYQRIEYLNNETSSQVYGSTPRLSASVAPQMLFGTPIYASMSSEYAFIPNQQISNGNVQSDASLAKWDVAPSLRVPLSRLTYLSANTSASYRSTYYSRSLDENNTLTSATLLRQFLTVRQEVVGPVLTKIWDTPDSTRTERMKHVIEPTMAVDYTTEMSNQANVPKLNDPSDYVVGGAARVTYGLNNRLFYRGRATEEVRGQTREFVTIGVQQTYYTNPEASTYDTSYVSRRKDVALSPVAFITRFSPTLAFDANTRVEYDLNGFGMTTFSTGGTFNATRASANLNFNRSRTDKTSPPSSFLSSSTSVRFREGRVTGAYQINWDLQRGYIVNQSMAASYMAQCCGIQAEFQNFNYQSQGNSALAGLNADRRFNVSIVLAGLGSISNFFGAFGGATTR